MTRVTLPPIESFTDEQRTVYDRFQSNLTRALLLTKQSAAPHLDLGAAFTEGLLSDLDREVIVLRVAYLRNSAFERHLHLHLALKSGLSTEDIADIESGFVTKMPAERAALVRYVDDCILQHAASEGSFADLRRYYSVREIAEITHLAGHAALTAMYLASLQIPLDDDIASWDNLADIAAADTH
ncbi:carboxymuconolactone decarboxylase family protein [Mycobacterium sp. PDNC021]|uniref:carboxymuconolactone decarboxylase family protein n=1 Tax=Mycobacterium sp. PDNC021 TaxID=3391399 RepID=UPI003AAC11AE